MAQFTPDAHLANPHLASVRLELPVRSIADYAIYMLGPQGVVITWNAGAERAKGYSTEEISPSRSRASSTQEDVV